MSDLFGDIDSPAPPAHRHAPSTSHRAALDIWPRTGSARRAVLDAFLAAPGPLTCEEVEDATRMPHTTVSARIWELRGKNRKAPLPVYLEDSGIERRTRSGSMAVAWMLTSLALAMNR